MSDWRAKRIEDAIAEVDAQVADTVRYLSAKWRDLGYTTAELPVVLRPMLDELTALRDRQVAELEAMLGDARRRTH